MKNLMKAAKIVAIGLFALAVTGCSSFNYKSVEPWQGKVWRVVVERQFIDSTGFKPNKEFVEATKYDESRDARYRISRIYLPSGWDSVIATAALPDNIEFSEVERGTVVDVMAEIGPNMDYSKQRFTRVLRIVCAKTDEPCIDNEKKSKRLGSVIEEKPSLDISARYGVTYSRRITDDELKKYN
jgi:hypothetical protein